MTMNLTPLIVAALTVSTLSLLEDGAKACTGAGVITRIVGRPQDVIILRPGPNGEAAPVARPRVLEVICGGDQIRSENGAVISLSLDGAGQMKVSGGQTYSVPVRAGAPTLLGNAYRSMNDHLLPDMKRQPWDVRLRGPGPALGFALSSLAADHQTITAGRHQLLVRLVGGVGGYKVELGPEDGAPLATASGESGDLLLSGLNLQPGTYVLRAADTSGVEVRSHIMVVAERPPVSDFTGLPDPEVQAAAQAGELARTVPDKWSFEAEQILASAPNYGLDRASVYELIESYGSE